MRAEGSFTCSKEPLAIEKETPAQFDSTRVRCFQDQWFIRGKEVVFHRAFYKSKDCENEIGTIDFHQSAVIASSTHVSPTSCSLTRTSADWMAEENGKCMLSSFVVGTPASTRPLSSCKSLVPSFCSGKPTVSLFFGSPSEKDFADQEVRVSSKNYERTCKRYLNEDTGRGQ